jgi:GNAT superfamily N-acetyltransferase
MYLLAKVETAAQWRILHQIRRKVLFDTGVFPYTYDESRPEDREHGNTPYLLLLSGEPIGVARLDIAGFAGIARMVGILFEHQRQGHGRMMGNLIDAEAVRQRLTELRVNAYKDAVGFYEKLGWSPKIWDAVELSRLAPGNVQMVKTIAWT